MKRFLLLLVFICADKICCAQASKDTMSYFMDWTKKYVPEEKGYYYRVALREGEIWHVKDYYVASKSLQMEGYYDSSFKIPRGETRQFYPNRQLKEYGKYLNGKKNGTWKKYYEDGKLADSMMYVKGIPYGSSYKFHKDGKIAFTGQFDKEGKGIGTETAFYDNSTIEYTGKYTEGYKKDSIWISYYSDGVIARKDSYKQGELLKNECYTNTGLKQDCRFLAVGSQNQTLTEHGDTINRFAEQMPDPVYDVLKFLRENIRSSPSWFSGNTTYVKIYVQFVVDEIGNISDIHIVSGLTQGPFADEAIRLVSAMPKWKPGMHNGRPVKVSYNIPIAFSTD
jgi:antitoxin component YwqK of YwqJK toxin-antitoxin module